MFLQSHYDFGWRRSGDFVGYKFYATLGGLLGVPRRSHMRNFEQGWVIRDEEPNMRTRRVKGVFSGGCIENEGVVLAPRRGRFSNFGTNSRLFRTAGR